MKFINKQYSQLGQEKWVLDVLDFKRNGTFVEVGAADGIKLSNTYVLEKDFGWKGLCIEPSRQFKQLQQNRACKLDDRVVFERDNEEVVFIEDYENGEHNWFSGIESTFDCHEVSGKSFPKNTISLNTLLSEHDFPSEIDYLSIDTEGSEWEILKGLDFSKWKVKLVTVETNKIEPKRTHVFQLLSSNGFIRVQYEDSKWDDWYYHYSLLASRFTYFDSVFKLNSGLNERLKDATEKLTRSNNIVEGLKKEVLRCKEQLALVRRLKSEKESEKKATVERLIKRENEIRLLKNKVAELSNNSK